LLGGVFSTERDNGRALSAGLVYWQVLVAAQVSATPHSSHQCLPDYSMYNDIFAQVMQNQPQPPSSDPNYCCQTGLLQIWCSPRLTNQTYRSKTSGYSAAGSGFHEDKQQVRTQRLRRLSRPAVRLYPGRVRGARQNGRRGQ
jgi:hypothetical protein